MDLRDWEEYTNIPVSSLHSKTKDILYEELNAPAPIRNLEGQYPDFRGLSNIIPNMAYTLIPNARNSQNPAKIIMDFWVRREDSTVQKLFCYLTKLGRSDIIMALKGYIDNDVRRYRSSNGTHTPRDNEDKYDVFVSYCDEDFSFVREQCIKELEKQHGIKLFIPDRDMLSGVQHEITAQLIEDKCSKTLIILSDDYLKSPQCQFQIRYAMALPQDAGINKIIPIIARPCRRVPRMLNFMTRIDYTRVELRQWFWPRLAKTIKHVPTTSTCPYRGDLKAISITTRPRPVVTRAARSTSQ